MKLVDLDPEWIGVHGGPPCSGISFRCPCKSGCQERLSVLFDPALDGTPNPGGPGLGLRWRRSGETFETLTLTPSIDASGFGHWHGHITNGEIA